MFETDFPDFTCDGDRITCEVDGFTCIAFCEYDDAPDAPDERDEGFWPSLIPESAGYIGPRSRRTLQRHTARAKAVIEAWKNDEWDYCGVCVMIQRDGIGLNYKYDHVLWGVERNYPTARKGNRNAYLREVANELLPDALDCARARMAQLIADWKVV